MRWRWIAAAVAVAPLALANDLSVDRRSIQMNDTVTITVSLEGPFATVDDVNIPLRNLEITGSPSVASEFSWINGAMLRRKVFRYRARPLGPGPALVGPLVIRGDGQRETLAPIALQVLPDRASGSNDPEFVLRELLATGRDPFFVVASADKKEVFAGERVVVTWSLYNAANVQQWQIVSVPKLTDFWSEELEGRSRDAEQVVVAGTLAQKLDVRRVALYPLRSGTHQVGGMTVEAAVMRRFRGGVFERFEGAMTEVEFTSAPVTITVKPLPPGPPVDAIGELTMSCGTPARKLGLVSFDVTLSGRGNVRAAARPRFAGNVDGTVQIEEGRVTSATSGGNVSASRTWRYLIFPKTRGTLEIPPLVTTIFDPSTAQRRELRCDARLLLVEAAAARSDSPEAAAPPRRPIRGRLPLFSGIVAAMVAFALATRVWLRQSRLRRTARQLVDGESPEATRENVDGWLTSRGVDPQALIRDQDERGDAYRALRSLIDAVARDRFSAEEREIERRVRDLIVTIRG